MTPRRLSAAAVATLLVLTLLPAGAGAAPGVRDDLDRSRSELREARESLGDVGRDKAATKRRIAALDDRLRSATDRLLRLEGELQRKRDRLVEAERALDRAVREHAAAEAEREAADAELRGAIARLTATERDLDASQETLDDQAVAIFKQGGPGRVGGLLTAVFGTASPSDAALGVRFVEEAVSQQKATLERINVLRTNAAVHREAAAAARDRARELEALARGHRAEIASLTEDRRALVDEVAVLVGDQRQLVRSVEVDQKEQQRLFVALHAEEESLTAEIEELEEESARLERELAAEIARQRAAEAARRARSGSRSNSGGGGGVSAGAPGAGELVWPTSGRLTSRYGYRTHPVTGRRKLHTGIDIGAPSGTAVVSAAAGEVIYAGWRGGYGNTVIVYHGGGLATLYAHLSRIYVSDGRGVSRGEPIAAVGSTGMSTGPHLHFEVRVNGEPRDPLDWY